VEDAPAAGLIGKGIKNPWSVMKNIKSSDLREKW
jgi:hypothetical protein